MLNLSVLAVTYVLKCPIFILKGNAEKSRIIMVGDMLKKASNKSGGGFIDIKDLSDTEYGILPFARVLYF